MNLGMLTFNTVTDIVTRRTTFARICFASAENGISELDMMAGEVSLYGEKRVARTMESCGLKFGSLIAHIPMSRRKDEKVAKLTEKSLELAARLGSPLLMIVPMTVFGAGRMRQADKEQIFENYVRYYSAAVKLAEGTGIKICFEDTPTCYLPLSSTSECKRLLDSVDGLGLVFDTANMLPGGSEPIEFYETLKSHVVRAHLKDAVISSSGQDKCADGQYMVCRAFGQGVIPVRELYEKLKSNGCEGAAIEYTHPSGHSSLSHKSHIKTFIDYLSCSAEISDT